jgi:hypothetical protein
MTTKGSVFTRRQGVNFGAALTFRIWAGPATMMASLSGCAARSRSDREAQGDHWDVGRVGYVVRAMFRVATEVAHP